MNESSLRLTIACYQLLCLRDFFVIFIVVAVAVHSFTINNPGFGKQLFQQLSFPYHRSGLAVSGVNRTCFRSSG